MDGRYPMTAGYVSDDSYLNGIGNYHSGIDIGAPVGTPTNSVVDGEVVFTSPDFFGVVTVLDDEGRYHIYKHLNEVFVSTGQQVSAGDLVGTVGGRGNTPNQFGPHLHYEVSQPPYHWGGVHQPDVRFSEEALRGRNFNPLQTYWDLKSEEVVEPQSVWEADVWDLSSGSFEYVGETTFNSDLSNGLSVNFGSGSVNDDSRFPTDYFMLGAQTQADFEAGRSYEFRLFGDDGFVALIKPVESSEWTYITPDSEWQQAYGDPAKYEFTPTQSGQHDVAVYMYEAELDAYLGISWGLAPPEPWSANFINLTEDSLLDYDSYDFSTPDATEEISWSNNDRNIIAQLERDYDLGSPNGIQTDFFAMEAQKSIELEAGKFYKLSSDSDDGTRFEFKDAQTGDVLTELNDNWRDRSVTDSTWAQLLDTDTSSAYDFKVQYYENTGNSTIDVTLEETARTGEVVYSQGLNLRSTPSTLNNTPIDGLDPGERFTIQQKVSSPDDITYPDWYEVVTDGGQQGYVAADSVFVDLIDAGRVAYSQGLNLREAPSTLNNTPIDGLDAGETFTIVQQVDSPDDLTYPDWYEVITSDGKNGYVAADDIFVEVIDGGDVLAIGETETLFDFDRIIDVVPDNLVSYAEDSIPVILEQIEDSGITDPAQVAYILGTVEHESKLGLFMTELANGSQYEGRLDLGNIYEGDGPRFKGRGYVQITGRRNYQDWSDRLEIDLVSSPEKAAEPEVAAQILVEGMRDGTFTGVKLSDYINGSQQDFFNARRIVNGTDRAEDIAQIARNYLTATS